MLLMVSCHFRDKDEICVAEKELVTVSLKANYFSEILVDAPYEVDFVQGNSASIRIEGKKDEVSNVITVCKGERLIIKNKLFANAIVSDRKSDVKIYVTSPDLTEVTVKGLGNFRVMDKIDTDTLRVNLLGAGDVKFDNVVCDVLYTVLKGSGDISMNTVEGVSASVCLIGAGDIDLNLLKMRYTDVKLIGVGDIEINFDSCKFAKCALVGVGDIKLKGNLNAFEKEKKGTGTINVDELKVE